MPLTPDIITYSELGGEKLEYSPVVDTSTDRSASEVNLAFAGVAAMSRMIPKVWISFTVNTSGTISSIVYDSTWKKNTIVNPTVTRTSKGKYLIEFPSTVYDELNHSQSLDFRCAVCSFYNIESVTNSGEFRQVEVMVYSANSIYIFFVKSDGTLEDPIIHDIAFNVIIF